MIRFPKVINLLLALDAEICRILLKQKYIRLDYDKKKTVLSLI